MEQFFTALAPLASTIGGAGAAFLTIIILIARGSLVPGSTHIELRESMVDRYTQMKDDRDYWRDIALDSMNALGATVGRKGPSEKEEPS